MKFDRYYVRKFPSHPVHSSIDLYFHPQSKTLLTHNFATSLPNKIIACNNATISSHLAEHFECTSESHWTTVAKHKSEILRMDMVVLMNTYCSVASRDQVWDLYYFCPPTVSPTAVRTMLLYEEQEEDKDKDDGESDY